MKRRTAFIVAALAVGAIGLGATAGVATATSVSEDDDAPITGADLQRATEAALAHTGEGTVSDSEVEGSSFEIEVVLDDGSQVELQLDESFAVVGEEVDHEDARDDD